MLSRAVALTVGVLVVCTAVGARGSGRTEEAAATATVEIPEVSCAGCSLDVRRAVKAAGGVRRIAEGHPRSRIVISYEPGPGRPEAYVDALRKAGFTRAHKIEENAR